jgi:hypothetical protein
MPKRPRPGHTPDLLPDPVPAPPPADAAAAPEPPPPVDGAPDAPIEPDFEARLRAVEAVCAEQREVITRQALEILLATENTLQLRESRRKVERLKGRAEEARAAATAAKNAYSTAVDEHFELEKDLSNATPRLPFRDEPEAAPAAPTETADVATGGIVLPPVAAGDESWRKVPLATLGIPEELPHSIVSILGEANLDTIGALSGYLQPSPATGFTNRLTDIPGIGPAKAEKIEAALDAFWVKWREWQAHKPEAATAPTEEAEGEVHPAPSAEDDEAELTGEYDLDGALRAGPGPVLPTAEETGYDEPEDDDEYPDDEDAS